MFGVFQIGGSQISEVVAAQIVKDDYQDIGAGRCLRAAHQRAGQATREETATGWIHGKVIIWASRSRIGAKNITLQRVARTCPRE